MRTQTRERGAQSITTLSTGTGIFEKKIEEQGVFWKLLVQNRCWFSFSSSKNCDLHLSNLLVNLRKFNIFMNPRLREEQTYFAIEFLLLPRIH